MHERILRNFVKQVLLSEEIVTVYRGKEAKLYDATFDKDGKLISAAPHVTSAADDELVSRIQFTTAVPPAAIYNLIASMGPLKNPQNPDGTGLQQVAYNPQNVVSTIESLTKANPEFEESLRWRPANEQGRGEATLKLAFKFSDAKEPDFVSADGEVRLSVKYFGDGTTSVRSGVGGGSIATFISEFGKILGIRNFGKTYSGADLRTDLNMISNPAQKLDIIKKCTSTLDKMKVDLAKAHGAQGIFGHDSSGIYYISPEDAPTKLSVKSIRESGSRVEFYGPHLPSHYTTMERVLEEAARVP